MSFIFFGDTKAEIGKEKFQYLKMVKLKISSRRKSQLVVLRQVMTNQGCGLAVIFCGFISHLIGRETINIPEIFSGVHGFPGKTVNKLVPVKKENVLSSVFLLPGYITWYTRLCNSINISY